MPELSTLDRAALEDLAGNYDIDPTGMDDDALRAAIVEAENSIDTSDEDDFEAGAAAEFEARQAAKRRAEGHDFDESTHPMVSGKTARVVAVGPAVGPRSSEAPKPRAPSGSSNGLKIEADRPEQNGVKRPSAGGKCRGIWDMLDEIGGDATAKQAREAGAGKFDKTTIMVQFYRWRKFNGVEGRQS